MTSENSKALAQALSPLVRRVRTDITAVKRHDGSRWTTDPLTPTLLEHHVNGGPARGVCPIREGQSSTLVALLDLDSHQGETSWAEMCSVAMEIIDLLKAQRYQPIAFRSSGGRGIHIMLLWDTPQDAYSVREMLADTLALAGYKSGAKGVKHGQIEIFPKQDAVGIGENGNQFILPLAGKSEPLDLLMDLEPMGKDWALHMEWPSSPSVPHLEKPVRDPAQYEETADPIEKVKSALAAIKNDGGPDSPDYEQWYAILCAVHEATGGSDEGREAVREWSSQNPIFDERFFERRVWPYIKPADSRSRATSRSTLYGHAHRAGWDSSPWTGASRQGDASGFEDEGPAPWQDASSSPYPVVESPSPTKPPIPQPRPETSTPTPQERYAARDTYKRRLAEATTELEVTDTICGQIAVDSLIDSVMREMLAETVKNKLAALGAKVGIAAARKLLTPRKPEKTDETAPWAEGWVYVTDDDKFYRLDSDELLSMQSFNAKFNRYLPPRGDEFRVNASWIALEEARIPTVTRRAYIPYAGRMFEMDGTEYANSFRPSTVPKAASKMTPEGQAAVDLILKHMLMICGGRQQIVDELVNWMAFNVQNPGIKIRWAPLIKGINGDGKSFLGNVMQAVMGVPNVNIIGPTVIQSPFSDWAHHACVGVLEEIRVTGHNRHEIENALKPFISNSHVQIHPKGGKPFNIVNTMNFIAFTNFSDALPLTDTDRRWLVIFSALLSLSDLQAAVGEVGAYFSKLFAAIEEQRECLRLWLEKHRIADSFQPNGRALMTQERASMIAMSTNDDDDALLAVIAAGGRGIGQKALVTKAVNEAIAAISGEQLKTSQMARALGKLGWVKVPQLIKWRGESVRTWVKGISTEDNDAIRAELDASLVTSDQSDPRVTGFDEDGAQGN